MKGSSRRSFFKTAGLLAGGPALLNADNGAAAATSARAQQAAQLRIACANYWLHQPQLPQPTNGDEDAYPNHIASFTKGLQHNALGVVVSASYDSLLKAIQSGSGADFEAILMGGTLKLVDPQAAYAFTLEGEDTQQARILAPPAFNSAEEAGEMAELYWQALTRDVPFNDYNTDSTIAAAVADMNRFSAFKGPKVGGYVTAGTLFRGDTPDDLIGPYISQFLWQPVPYGDLSGTMPQLYRTILPGNDQMTSYSEWLRITTGQTPVGVAHVDHAARYIRNGRDLAEYVHRDFSFQAYINAALMLISYGTPAVADSNPYKTSATQAAFVTWGIPGLLDLVSRAAVAAFKAGWYQKWLAHRRLRPEVFGGRVHNHLTGAATYPINSELLGSTALKHVFTRNGNYLLPQAFPEGSPAHPAYPSGHACAAGSCVTVLKALFNESFVIPNPVVASSDGESLLPYRGPALTVGGELNKLASNVPIGRDAAGIHWRTDAIQGLLLGEQIGLGILRDCKQICHETFPGFTITKFDGTVVTV
jgi:hypothetical protein